MYHILFRVVRCNNNNILVGRIKIDKYIKYRAVKFLAAFVSKFYGGKKVCSMTCTINHNIVK